jgi:hypothetical protein
LNNLLDEIEDRFASASERDARISIANAAAEVSHAIAHLPPFLRMKEARARVQRWFSEQPGTSGAEGSADDDFDDPQRFIPPRRRTGEEPEI